MNGVSIVENPHECKYLWERTIPGENITDLWDVRACFHKHFKRPLCFLVFENSRDEHGLLPLSWIEESDCYGYFPGETWEGKTWLEQNRVPAMKNGLFEYILEHCPGDYHLRYILPMESEFNLHGKVDEVGYVFYPGYYDYDIENYFKTFSHKSAKRIRKELAAIETLGVTYRYNNPADFEHLVRLNRLRFGIRSYFHDPRFLEGFRSLMNFLNENGWLQLTSLIIQGEIAAVDLGSLYRGSYTLLAGGTNPDYPGIAKLINFHHMRRSCMERFDKTDFLCGDFSWKKIFHLTPRPLYLMSNTTIPSYDKTDCIRNEKVCLQNVY
jgi:hypothetical protein